MTVSHEAALLFDAAQIVGRARDTVELAYEDETDPKNKSILRMMLDSIPQTMFLLGYLSGDVQKKHVAAERSRSEPSEPTV